MSRKTKSKAKSQLSCRGCKFLIREEDAPECFLAWPVKEDDQGIPRPVEKCGKAKVEK